MRVSENRGPLYSTLNNRIIIIRTLKYGTIIFGNPLMVREYGTPKASSRLSCDCSAGHTVDGQNPA